MNPTLPDYQLETQLQHYNWLLCHWHEWMCLGLWMMECHYICPDHNYNSDIHSSIHMFLLISSSNYILHSDNTHSNTDDDLNMSHHHQQHTRTDISWILYLHSLYYNMLYRFLYPNIIDSYHNHHPNSHIPIPMVLCLLQPYLTLIPVQLGLPVDLPVDLPIWPPLHHHSLQTSQPNQGS